MKPQIQSFYAKMLVISLSYSMLKNWKQFLDCLHTLKCFLPTYPLWSQELSLDTWKISSWAIFKLSVSESKRRKKKKKHEVGVWICPKRRNKRHFALLPLFLEFFTMTQHSLPKLWGFVFWFGFFLFYFILFPQRIESPLSWRQVWTYSVCRWRVAPGNSSGRAIRNRKSSIARHKSNHASQRWITTGGVKKAQT